MPTTITITQDHVDQKTLSYEDHKRGRNWIATVAFDPSAPGSLNRSFWETGSAAYRKVPEDLKAGHILEVGADYYTTSGNKQPSRSYYRVVGQNDAEIILEPTDCPDENTTTADQWRNQETVEDFLRGTSLPKSAASLSYVETEEYGRPGNPDWERIDRFELKTGHVLEITYDGLGGVSAEVREQTMAMS